MKWNPRYLAYCAAQGVATPEAMLAQDDERWPGGRMAGFLLWISDRWAAWCAARGRSARDMEFLSDDDHRDFTDWLRVGNAGA